MFTPVLGGALISVISATLIVSYIPVLCVFHTNPEFRAVLAYRLMFWTGICDVSQLIMFLLSGVMAMLQSAFFHYYINKLCGSTLYAFWFCTLYLSIVTTLNRFVCVVLSGRHFAICNYLSRNVIYILALMIFVISWAVKLTPYSGYIFKPSTLDWCYDEKGIKILSRLSYYFGTYGILFHVACCITVYSIIAARIVIVRREPLKWTEVVLTLQQFLVSLVFFFAFLYWNFVDTSLERTILTNFVSNLLWMTTVGLNPLIYLFVNKRLRRSLKRIGKAREATTTVGGLTTAG